MKKFSIIVVTILSLSVVLMATAVAEVQSDLIEAEFTIDLTSIILAVFGVLFSIAAKYLYPLLKTEKNKRLARIAVYAAEQLFNSGEIEDKLEWAEKWLIEHGVKINTRVLIESIVGEMNEYKSHIDYDVASNYVINQNLDESSVVDTKEDKKD